MEAWLRFLYTTQMPDASGKALNNLSSSIRAGIVNHDYFKFIVTDSLACQRRQNPLE
jgi:hypothetical protein